MNVKHCALTVSITAALLAGCGGSPPPIGAPGAMPKTSGIATNAAHGKSWTLPHSSTSDLATKASTRGAYQNTNDVLLYISTVANNAVYIVTYPKGKAVATISGVLNPAGMCSDLHGNIFITSTGPGEIVEFAHGGTTPIATLNDPGYEPVDCAIDPVSGNLAVSNFANGTPGNIAIYQNAAGSPTFYSDPELYYFRSCTYDDSGNLWVVGEDGTADFAELPSGSSKFQILTLPFANPGGIKWDGTYLAIGSQFNDSGVIKRVSVSGTKVEVVQTVPVLWKKKKHSIALRYFVISPKRLVGAFSNEVGFWAYPQGGNPQKIFRGYTAAEGVALSVPP